MDIAPVSVNALLTFKVRDQAAQHCGDRGRHIGDRPKRLGKDTAAQARNLGQDIALKTKKWGPGSVSLAESSDGRW